MVALTQSSSSAERVRIAIVGAGAIAELAHIPALASIAEAKLVAFVDPEEARRETLRGRWPAIPAHATLADLEKSGLPDAIIVAAPPEHHLEPALWARRHDLHLYLEKPVAASRSDVDRLVDAWRDAESVAMMGLNYRFHPAVIELRERISRGEIGRLVTLHTVFATPAVGPDDWRGSARSGGGALLDLGTHHLDLLSHLTGTQIVDVACVMNMRATENDTAHLTATLSTGCTAQCAFVFGAAETDRIEVIGERGALTLDRLNGSVAARSERFGYTRGAALGRARALMAAAFDGVTRARGEPSYRAALAAWLRKIRGLAVHLPTLEDGARLHRLVERAASASTSGERLPVSIDEADTS